MTFVGISIGRKVPVELGKIQSKSLTIKGTIGSPGVWPAAIVEKKWKTLRDRELVPLGFCAVRCRRAINKQQGPEE